MTEPIQAFSANTVSSGLSTANAPPTPTHAAVGAGGQIKHGRRQSSLLWFWLGLGAIVALGALLFARTLQIGFLLDDFFHIDYLIRAFNGQPEALYRLLWSNWSSDTTLTSYRPFVSLSLGLDYALWGINAWGYHLTNIALFCASIALVGIIGQQLADVFEIPRGNIIGLTASLLFACYPLHPEAVAWIIGRVDVLSSCLTLLSVVFYLRHRAYGGAANLSLCLASFLLALGSKEMAVTLPVALTLLELLAPTKPAGGKTVAIRKMAVPQALLWVWGLLIGFAIWRTLILGTVVGGYGGSGWKTIKQGVRNFLDVPTALKLLYGASDEFPIAQVTRNTAFASIGGIVVLGLAQIRERYRVIAFLAAWTVITVLPTFQIWHIWPNLVGSRLFFLGSAPLCLLLAFMAVGTRRIPALAGATAIIVLSSLWCGALVNNLQAWYGAADQFEKFKTELTQRFNKLSQNGGQLLIPTLPQDFKGAPILGRPEYLSMICRPPFASNDYRDSVITLEPVIAGGTEFVSPSLYKKASQSASLILTSDDPAETCLLGRLNEPESVAPLVTITPHPPLTLTERHKWLKNPAASDKVISYDARQIAGAATVKIYVSRPWYAFTNAPRPVQPDPQAIEFESENLPLSGRFTIPGGITSGVHDVAVMTFSADGKPVGNLSESLPINIR